MGREIYRARGLVANGLNSRHKEELASIERRFAAILDVERKQSQELVNRLAKVRFGCRRDDHKYRVACELEIDPMAVRCLSHGNDTGAISYVAGHLAHLVEKELHTINFARLPEVTERLEWSGPLGAPTDKELHERAAR